MMINNLPILEKPKLIRQHNIRAPARCHADILMKQNMSRDYIIEYIQFCKPGMIKQKIVNIVKDAYIRNKNSKL
jgi:hypothetical protein